MHVYLYNSLTLQKTLNICSYLFFIAFIVCFQNVHVQSSPFWLYYRNFHFRWINKHAHNYLQLLQNNHWSTCQCNSTKPPTQMCHNLSEASISLAITRSPQAEASTMADLTMQVLSDLSNQLHLSLALCVTKVVVSMYPLGILFPCYIRLVELCRKGNCVKLLRSGGILGVAWL